jgi:hypothetical protein
LKSAFGERDSRTGQTFRAIGRRRLVASLLSRLTVAALAVWVALALPVACQHGPMSVLDPLAHQHQASHLGHHIHSASPSDSAASVSTQLNVVDPSESQRGQPLRHLLRTADLGTPMALVGMAGLAPHDSLIDAPLTGPHHRDSSVLRLSGTDLPSSDPPPRA